ncbi:hypothetical protein IHE50_00595 [Candidatus Parvarchaeota archaeon]|uniref:Uncharacterized protein n=1 Tax=Candidatus Acidifodinimicrobium mancum TaxID=2898728 RepID=A0A8T3UYM4_9ARCH|nr:hypothetical protein [Candidatus Acidifodinimicrobium mancum]
MIIGYQLSKIDAERNDSIIPQDPIEISYRATTKSVGKDQNSKTLRFVFDYQVDLKDSKDNKVGKIYMEGTVIYAGTGIEEAYKKLTETGVMQQDIQQEVMQAISNMTIIEAMQISKTLNLPPIIKLPELTSGSPEPQKEEKKPAKSK